MPTSSQALILHKSVDSRIGQENVSDPSLCTFKEPVSYSIATVYNLSSGCVGQSAASAGSNRTGVHIMSRESAHIIKSHSLPHSFSSTGSISDERPLNPFNSPAESSDAISGNHAPHTSGSISCCREATSKSSLQDNVPLRPQTAIPKRSTSRKTHVNPFMYERLVNLGFRSSTLVLDKDCVFDSFSGRKTPFANNPSKSRISRKSTRTVKTDDAVKTTETRPRSDDSAAEGDSDSDNDSDSVDVNDGWNRIKPSMHMRKDVPESRPQAAIFSFRDNEYSSHAEVKYLIQTQIGLKVKCIQFDPLDIRVAKPGVHSRWIVDFHSDSDLEKAIRKGLVLGKDKLIFYKHDDLAKREVNSFKYFMTIQEAKKKLKSSSIKAKKVTSERQPLHVSQKMRSTKSTNITSYDS